jgi:hypothetical protein
MIYYGIRKGILMRFFKEKGENYIKKKEVNEVIVTPH